MKYVFTIVRNEANQSLEATSEAEGYSSYNDISRDLMHLPEILGCAYGHILRDTVFKDAVTPVIVENFTKWVTAGPSFCEGIKAGLNNETRMKEEV